MQKKKEYILYLGNYLNEFVVNERELPTNNPAGSNRMHRIAQALSVHYNPVIVSPGVSLNIKLNKSAIFKKTIITKDKGVLFYFPKTLAIPFLGLFYSYFTYFIATVRLLMKTKTVQVVVYNFDPLFVFLVLFIKIIKPRIKVINNVEDISRPSLMDFKSSSEDRPMQQLIFYLCMKIIAHVSDGFIIPTKRFKDFLPYNKPFLVVTGCIKVNQEVVSKSSEKLVVFFSGKIAFEHGIDVFIEALKKIDNKMKYKNIEFRISGGGPKSEWLENQVKNFRNINVTYYGFVSNEEYNNLLEKTDVCVALQKETGRHSNYKTPSKVYEYLGNSKIVIATDVGDLVALDTDIITICKPLTSENLMKCLIEAYEMLPELSIKRNKIGAYTYNHFDTSRVGNQVYNFITTINHEK
ncbi:glycosyltransferase [Mariniflexile sp.]|uniref:glycosyltransferase n=1 Tax=Mariniflexile sp. TaxID=1979402 RepID=UPI0035663AA1